MIVPLLPMGCSPTTARMLGAEKRYHHHGGAPGIVAAALRETEPGVVVIRAADSSVWVWRLQPGAREP